MTTVHCFSHIIKVIYLCDSGLYVMPRKPSGVLFQISNLLIKTDFSLSSRFRSFSFKDNESKNKNPDNNF